MLIAQIRYNINKGDEYNLIMLMTMVVGGEVGLGLFYSKLKSNKMVSLVVIPTDLMVCSDFIVDTVPSDRACQRDSLV